MSDVGTARQAIQELAAQKQCDQLGEIALGLLDACTKALEHLSAGVLDWGDPQDLCDPDSEYAQATEVANALGAAIEAVYHSCS